MKKQLNIAIKLKRTELILMKIMSKLKQVQKTDSKKKKTCLV